MKIIPFNAVSPADWDKVADHSGDAWLFHRADWVAIEARFAARGNFAFAVGDGKGSLIGIHPLYCRRIDRGWEERLLDSGYHRHAGLALLDELPENSRQQAVRLVMDHLFVLANRLDVDRILLNRQNLAPRVLASPVEEIPFWVRDHGFELGMHLGPHGDLAVPGSSTVFADQILLLDRPEEELFARVDKWAVRKGEKNGLTFVSQVDNPIGAYYALAQTSAQRTGEPLQPREYYQDIWDRLGPQGRVAVHFAEHQGRRVAAILLLVDKHAISYLSNVSDPEALPLCVNDFLHWQALCWAKARGVKYYRFGPIFPELPDDWPVCRVSFFKSKFGGRSYPVIQGNYFCKPERYRVDCLRVAQENWQARQQVVSEHRQKERDRQAQPALDLATILRRDGFMGIAPRPKEAEVLLQPGIWHPRFAARLEDVAGAVHAIFAMPEASLAPLAVQCHTKPGPAWITSAGLGNPFRQREPVYRALCPHVTFSGASVEAIWRDADGAAVVAWYHGLGKKLLLVGLDPLAEIVRYTQGDPEQVYRTIDRSRFNYPNERANFLFDSNLVSGHTHVPWADRLGFTLVRLLAQVTGLPLAEPLPGGAAGTVLLTGDDDQAALAKYREQLELVGTFPITYFLLPMTRHTPATLAVLSPSVEIGLHVDALEQPDDYDRICAEQAAAVRQLSSKPVRVIRNHGFLSRGYQGHLHAWESAGLALDVNYAGLDGTILNGSLLPGPVRRPDGSWSSHLSLLTAFGDGMFYVAKLTEAQCVEKIETLARQVERTDPGVLVFNMHPENVSDARHIHRAILALGRRPRWNGMGAETYLNWLRRWNQLVVRREGAEVVLHAPQPMTNLVLKHFNRGRWQSLPVPAGAANCAIHSLRPAA